MSELRSARRKKTAAPSAVDDLLKTPGKPLDASVRAGMEQRFDHDFSQVRIHIGADAERAAFAADAEALTVGQQAQFDALISFTFNNGPQAFRDSGLRRAVNENRFNDVPAEMNRWTRSGGAVKAGLVRRRAAEGRLFTTGAYQ
jgi:hypothetical protein